MGGAAANIVSDSKLARDSIPDIILKSGLEPEVRRLTGDWQPNRRYVTRATAEPLKGRV